VGALEVEPGRRPDLIASQWAAPAVGIVSSRFRRPRNTCAGKHVHGRWRYVGGNWSRKPGRGQPRGFDSLTFR